MHDFLNGKDWRPLRIEDINANFSILKYVLTFYIGSESQLWWNERIILWNLNFKRIILTRVSGIGKAMDVTGPCHQTLICGHQRPEFG